jgi:hypothetical protein
MRDRLNHRTSSRRRHHATSSHRPPVRAKIIGSTSRWVLRRWAFGVGEVGGELVGEGAGLAVPVTTVCETGPPGQNGRFCTAAERTHRSDRGAREERS